MLSLHNYSLRQKLILFAVLPMFMLGIFGIIRAWGLHQDFKTAHRNALAIQVSGQIADLIYDLQQERGYQSKEAEDSEALSQQQANTDATFRRLMQSDDLAKLLVVLDEDAHLQLAQQLTELKTSLNQLSLSRNQDVAHSTAGDTDFFDKLNNKLLLLVNQLQHQTDDAAQSRAYADLLLVLRAQELAARERSLVNDILSSNTLELAVLQPLENLWLEQAHTMALAQDTFEDEHRLLLLKLLASLPNQQVEQIRQRLGEQRQIAEIAQQLSELIGFGAMVHRARASLLHGEPATATSQQQWQEASLLLSKLREFCHLSDGQQQALQSLTDALSTYHQPSLIPQDNAALSPDLAPGHSNLEPGHSDAEPGRQHAGIALAIQALKTPPPPIDAALWWQFASEQIGMLHGLSHDIGHNIEQLSRHQMRMALLYIAVYSLASALTLLLSLLLGRKIIASFMNKIEAIAAVMQQMAADPTLELTIKTKGSDEIARMAQAMNTMLGQRKKYRQELSRAAAVFKYSAEGIIVTDADNHIELVNPAFTQITGYSLDEVKGRNPSMLSSHRNSPQLYAAMWESLQATDKWEGEIWNRRKDGQVYPEYLALTLVRDDEGRIVQHIGLFMDISRRKQYEQDLWYKANFDTLTDLPNRKLLSERLAHEIKMASHDSRKLAVMVLDLDRFKFINDTRGHECGDALLKAVTKRLQALLGPTDFLARIGGDEFVLVLPRLAQELMVEQQAMKVLQALGEPFVIEQQQLELSASLGIGLYPEDGQDVESLLSNAETALFGAKDDGRNNFKYFTPMMNQAMVERHAMERALRRAMLRREFLLHYQPVVDIKTGEVTGLEALLRWQDPDKGLISPSHFIPVAEDMGLMVPLGQWVIDTALGDLAALHAQGFGLSMAINVSACQCRDKQQGLAQQLAQALNRHGIAPRHLHVEITESMLMDDSNHCLATLNHIRDLGCTIYLDDFGTGYSSLSYLKKFPISVIKIDRSFVENLPDCESDASLIRAIIQMGKSLGMKLVAEGIETEEQQAFLQVLGSDYGQGYLYSRPLPLEALSDWLDKRVGHGAKAQPQFDI
ncbi:EAL domain-containing protein [Shewanella sp. JM162201]|uniref:EAL domain-containing protein n=1 Tax=Shewanella jiangmenensis TaxID=2837387 RepID=A0ABS5V8P7_9GAMM|nr:EAL domain-containing protein [Shewanella jiangmenensis]MBT1446111.1 EAL domain-containing protein [Shewanella jiangmenensis]